MALALLCTQAFAQTKEIIGKVTDSKDGNPLSGVTVKAKNANNSTITSSDGTFKLTVAPSVSALVFTFVGYEEFEATASELVNVSLTVSDKSLSEVVVVGYGTTVKRDLASSTVRVKGTEVANTPVPNFNQALQGRAAGVFVESNNGKVGEGVKVRIRGQGSINASNAPLYVVDGIPINTGSISGNALADINFNDVETFDVLKDAAATAIYGSRAANGVILITTKKGKSGAPKYSIGFQYGINTPTNKREFLNSAEYIELFTEAATNSAKYNFNRAGNPYGYVDEQEAIDEVVGFVEGRFTRYSGCSDWKTLETNTNWEDLAFQNAHVASVNGSASGGN